jgi:hypothetical protein
MLGGVCSDVASGATAHVSLTEAVVDAELRADFDRASIQLLAKLPHVPGLLMYSIRREVLGEQAWTMTAWRTAADRRAFVASRLHGRALTAGTRAVREMRSLQLELPIHELPMDWSKALQLLAEDRHEPKLETG